MELSARLQAVADMIPAGRIVADIGTDHGYLPIYLIQQERSKSVIASDVRLGPLSRAEQNIRAYGLQQYIEVRLSDGLENFRQGEMDCLILAGMGGGLMLSILKRGASVLSSVREIVLQPQSDVREVRVWLQAQNYLILEEEMVLEEGKFYPIVKATRSEKQDSARWETSGSFSGCFREETGLRYGRLLLQRRHPVLKQFLQGEEERIEKLLQALSARTGERIRRRVEKLREELQYVREGLALYE